MAQIPHQSLLSTPCETANIVTHFMSRHPRRLSLYGHWHGDYPFLFGGFIHLSVFGETP